MKLKTLLGLVVVAHAVAHPAVHALPPLTAPPQQAQLPASPDPSSPQVSSVVCPGCLTQRGILALSILTPAVYPRWERLVLLPLTPQVAFSALTRPARAPPAPSALEGPLA